MSKSVALLFVLFFLTASCVMVAKPALSSAEMVEDSWASKAPMQQARSGLGVAVVNGKIYAIGGSTRSGEVGTNEEYDPATDTWTFKKPMPTPRASFATAVYQNKIYCIGGRVNEVYDPATDKWETKTPMPTARSSLKANVVNGKIYLIGGVVPDSSAACGFSSVTLNEVYDPSTDSWTTKTPMPHVTSSGASVTVDGKIYVIGGLGPEHPGESLNQIYDPETDTWRLGATPPWGIGYGVAGATAGVNAPKRIYCVYDGTQVYDPINDIWTFGTDVPTGRMSFAVAVVDDRLYAMGGLTVKYVGVDRQIATGEMYEDVFYAVNEQYTPFGYGTVPPMVQVVSLENMTYAADNVPLAFAVNKPAVWMGYSLDGQDNVTVAGNATLSGLANGLHNVAVYAKDTFGHVGVSEPVSFSVEVPFPAMLVVAPVASVVVVGAVLAIYFKKRKR
jgi:N-acetylneuraminic acid mutarotase